MKAIKLEVHLVTLENNNVDVKTGRWYSVPSSEEAEAKIERINKNKDTKTAILEYRLTLAGDGVYGDVTVYDPYTFKTNIEPQMELNDPDNEETD